MVSHGQEAEGLFEGKMKILKLFRDFCYCPEEDLLIFCLLSEAALACFQLSRLLMGLGKGLAGPSPVLACKMCQCQDECWIFIEQIQGLRKEEKKTLVKEYITVYSEVCICKKQMSKKSFNSCLFLCVNV